MLKKYLSNGGYDNSGRVEYTGKFTLHNGEHVLTVTSDDGYGYRKEEIRPVITVWDDTSGVKEISYLLDGISWTPSEIRGKGKHTLTVTAEDVAGNRRTETV
ncbi:MAG: hypothetical protein J6A77_03355 [Lachnospiraceae bacterium]|nr:hypothetical protein [Lachnospiraceae bacterium]